MNRFRKVLFWLHLIAGATAGLVIFVVALTGMTISFERQIQDRANAGLWATPAPGVTRLPLKQLLTKAQASQEGKAPSAVSWRSDEAAPVSVSFGRELTIFFNPYTGAALGEGAKDLRDFFRTVTEVHRWFALSGENREIGKAVTGASSLVFFFLVVSGLYLWWPRSLRWKSVRAIVFFDGRLKGRTRDWNWHNVFGFWACVPLFFITMTGVIMSYTWANNLLFQLTGNEPPPARTAPAAGGPGAAAGERREGGPGPNAMAAGAAGERREGGGEGRGREGGPRREGGRGGGGGFEAIDRLATAAERQVPDWRTITARLPATFMIEQSHRGRPDKKITLNFDAKTGAVASTETFASYNMGRKLRLWSRWVHTGEAGGVAGQIVALFAATAAAVLVWTGFALSVRRFIGWRRKKKSAGTPVETDAPFTSPQEAEAAAD